jgi:hypothetical protein
MKENFKNKNIDQSKLEENFQIASNRILGISKFSKISFMEELINENLKQAKA